MFSTIEEWARDNDIKLGGAYVIGYDVADLEEMFGDLNQEEIDKITDEIMKEVEDTDDYEKEKDSIIEKVFKDNGITDIGKIEAAKSVVPLSVIVCPYLLG